MIKARDRLIGLAAVSIAVLALSPPFLAQSFAEGCPTACPNGRVRIGMISGLSGSFADYGSQVVKGAQAAIKEVNDKGGLGGFPVEVVTKDDACEAGKAVVAAQQLVAEERVAVVVGPVCTGGALAAARLFKESKVLQIVPVATALQLTREGSPLLFRLNANDDQQAAAAAGWLARQSSQAVAIVHVPGLAAELAANIMKRLPETLRSRSIIRQIQTDADVGKAVADIQQANAGAIYAILSPTLSVQFERTLREKGVKSKIVTSATGFGPGLRQTGDGFADWSALGAIDLAAREFATARDLLRNAGVDPDAPALFGFASIQVWAQAIAQTGHGDPEVVAEALKSGMFKTAIGTIKFGDSGDRTEPKFSSFRWNGKELVPLQ